MTTKFLIVKTTYSNQSEAENLSRILLKKNLAACVQFWPIKSFYNWQNKIVEDAEILVSIKTKAIFYKKIEKEILLHHSYKVPQIVAIEIDSGLDTYFEWIEKTLI